MTNLEDHLEHELHDAAARLDPLPGDLGTVMARGRARGRRQALTSVVAVALVAGTIAAASVYRRGSHGQSIDAASGTGAAPAPARTGDVDVAWQQVDPHSALAYGNITGGTTAGSNLYAVSTAPGVHDPTEQLPNVLYRSADGVSWTQANGPTGEYLSDVAASGNQLYAVGTGPSTVADHGVAPLEVASSSDGGTTWSKLSLPIDMSPIEASSLDQPGELIQVAANNVGAVVVAQISDNLNVPHYLPAGVTASYGWVQTATGIDVLGPETASPCPAGTTEQSPSTTTAEVGPAQDTICVPPGDQFRIDPAAGNSVKDLVSGSGTASSPAAQFVKPTVVPPLSDHSVAHTYTWAQLGITGAVLQAVLGEPFVFTSAGGSPLRAASLPGTVANLGDIQVAAGTTQFAIAGEVSTGQAQQQQQEMVWTSADGSIWSATPALPADQAGPAAIGYLGGELTLVSSSGPTVARLVGEQWSEVSLAPVLGATATATGKSVQTVLAAIGPFGIVTDVVVLPQVSTSGVGEPNAPVQSEDVLLASRDGVTWTTPDLNTLAGQPVVGVVNLAVTATTFVVTVDVNRTSAAANTPAPESVLVGAAR